ncbi:MAG: RluA family pseudouridine synthase [Bacteroidia bacterium]
MTTLNILFEDNHLLVINKPAGMLVQVDKSNDTSLEIEAQKYIKDKYKKPGDAFVGIPHRLDRPTSGIVLIARTSKCLVRLNEDFKNHSIKKTYWAIVKQKPAKLKDTLTHYLLKNETKNHSKAHIKEVKGGLLAKLSYEVIASSDKYHLLEIDLHTGRHHQIRAQLQAIGCSIKGDLKYGSERSNPDGSICLHARAVRFEHPVRKEELTLTAPAPNDSLWAFFENEVKANKAKA